MEETGVSGENHRPFGGHWQGMTIETTPVKYELDKSKNHENTNQHEHHKNIRKQTSTNTFTIYVKLENFQQYFSYFLAVSFVDGGNRSIRRKPSTFRGSLTHFITLCCIEYTSPLWYIVLLTSHLQSTSATVFRSTVRQQKHCDILSINQSIYIIDYNYHSTLQRSRGKQPYNTVSHCPSEI
jgi:hypothetical protein